MEFPTAYSLLTLNNPRDRLLVPLQDTAWDEQLVSRIRLLVTAFEHVPVSLVSLNALLETIRVLLRLLLRRFLSDPPPPGSSPVD